MKITRFEDLKAWQRSRELFKMVHEVLSRAPFCKNLILKNQMMRASLSIMSNISEGFDRGGDKEFIQFLYISKGSCSELKSQLFAARDTGYLEQVEFQAIFDLAEEISRILQGLISAMKKNSNKGRKFFSAN